MLDARRTTRTTPSAGARPAATSSLRRNASALAWRRLLGRRGEQRELVGEQVVDLGVGLLGLEHARDGVARARGASSVAAWSRRRGVRVERLDAGHREQVAAALVADQAHAQERLEPAAEAAAGAPHALRDRADPPARRRVEVQDPIGLAVAQRAQHDRLGLGSVRVMLYNMK